MSEPTKPTARTSTPSGKASTAISPPKSPLPPPGKVKINLADTQEYKDWIASLEAESVSVQKRNKYLWAALAAGVLLLLLVTVWLYNITVLSYAVIEDVVITRHPVNQGKIKVSFRVVSPGRVCFYRSSGSKEAELNEYFKEPRKQFGRSWSGAYEPGEDLDVKILSRGGIWWSTEPKSFPTFKRGDIVILMDTTGSMTRYIDQLKEKCKEFSKKLKDQDLKPRFALIAFGDISQGQWFKNYKFTEDVEVFQQSVTHVERKAGGDLPESALDAIEEALTLPFDEKATRRFFLVTDARFHSPSALGSTAEMIREQLEKKGVLLSVFSRAEYEKDEVDKDGNVKLEGYEKLIGDTGKWFKLEEFGTMLSEGSVLED